MLNKKVAMLGLEGRALKKLHHPELDSASQDRYAKRGAMFGLDARIALAIFGALSVISGAALYGAIKQAKVTAIITELNEIGKAHDAYILDTGQVLPSAGAAHKNYGESYNLIINEANLPGWKGPYLSKGKYKNGTDSNGSWLKQYKTGKLIIPKYQEKNSVDCSATGCFVWIRMDIDNQNLELIKVLDLKIDGADDKDNGDVIYYPIGTDLHGLEYKYSAISQNLVY